MAKIIVVDDSAFMRGSLKAILESAGHEVVALGVNGKEACELYQAHKPDLVTLDVLMADVDGLQGLGLIMKADPSARVLMVTSLTQFELEKQAKELGAAGFVRKPFNPEDVTKGVELALGKAAAPAP